MAKFKYPSSTSRAHRNTSNRRRKYGERPIEMNPITNVDLFADSGEWVFEQSGLPYRGYFHVHKDGTAMIGAGKLGAIHELKPEEVIVRSNYIRPARGSHAKLGRRK